MGSDSKTKKLPSSHSRKYVSDFPCLVEKWDFENNKGIDFSNVAAGSNKKYYWVCNKGHSYLSSPKSQKRNGCSICAGKTVIKGINDLETLEPKLAKEWDYDNNEKKPYEYTRSSGAEVSWICSICGHHWNAKINNRTSHNSGCPNCSTSKQTSFP